MADRSWDVALQREQARQQRQREGGRATDLSDRLMDPTAGAPPPAVGVGTGSPYQMDGWSLGSSMLDMDTQTVVMDQGLQTPAPPSIVPAGTLLSDDLDADTLLQSLVSNLPEPTIIAPSVPSPPQTTVQPSSRRARRSRRGVGVGTSSTTTATKRRTRRHRPYPSATLPEFAATEDDETNQRQSRMQRQLDLLQEDQRQANEGRRIRNITHTNTVTTVYEEGRDGTPTVRRTSTRNGPGRRTRQSRATGA